MKDPATIFAWFSSGTPAKRTSRVVLLLGAAALLTAIATTVHFDIKGHFDGFFLLKGRKGWKYELKDDLYVGDGDRVLYSIDFKEPGFRLFTLLNRRQPNEPHLYYQWDARDGSGFVRNFLGDGTQLLTSFGRYMDDDKEYVHGLFVGGGLPASVTGGDNVFMDETGMAYYDGRRWYHIWCNVNEGIIPAVSRQQLPPSQWQFLGSRVINRSSRHLAVTSSHQVTVDGVPLRIDRYVYLNAGETYFVLTIKITNIGQVPAAYVYLYGDEPWVGNYGSSAGNVGWVKDRIVNYESDIDTGKYSYAGIYHYGNSAIGEGHDYTRMANFLEWFGNDKPLVYFSNAPGVIDDTSGTRIPLKSNARFLGLVWGPRQLAPQETASYTLAVGMAGHDPASDFPVKPPVKLNFVP